MTMLNQQISQIIAAELTVQPQQILAAIQLLYDGNTVIVNKPQVAWMTPNFVILKPV